MSVLLAPDIMKTINIGSQAPRLVTVFFFFFIADIDEVNDASDIWEVGMFVLDYVYLSDFIAIILKILMINIASVRIRLYINIQQEWDCPSVYILHYSWVPQRDSSP